MYAVKAYIRAVLDYDAFSDQPYQVATDSFNSIADLFGDTICAVLLGCGA